MPESKLLLAGLDASNPLGFMAALGLLRVLTDEIPPGQEPPYRLSWRDNGRWLAEIHGVDDAESLISRLHADLASWSDERALTLAYNEDGALLSAQAPDAIFDLKPKPEAFRDFCDQVAREATPRRLRSARLIGAYGSEVVLDNNGNLKPTSLHFTAGQQRFLDMVRQLRAKLTVEDFREALFGPWRNESKLPSLSWNASAPRIYAYRATNPSGEKRGSVPAADWLAFCGLSFFPVAVERGRLSTTAIRGGWKDSTMRWPVWEAPITAHTLSSLLALLPCIPKTEMPSIGITGIYQAAILRSDQGGYGSFTPASIV